MKKLGDNMIILKEKDLRILQKIELEIALEVKRICEENNIAYSLMGGTLLGAVRHKGFIPWDDDIDLIMTRENYDKFLKITPKVIDSERFYIANYDLTPEIGEPFTKIMRKGTVMQELFTEGTGAPNGVYIDLFPLDHSPDNPILRAKQRYLLYSLKKRILIKSGYNFRKTGVMKLIYTFIRLTTFSGKTRLIRRLRKAQTRYNNKPSRNLVMSCGGYGYVKDSFPAAMLKEYTMLEFEGKTFSAFKEYDAYLRRYYDDYMKLPPKEEQVCKHKLAAADLSLYGGIKI